MEFTREQMELLIELLIDEKTRLEYFIRDSEVNEKYTDLSLVTHTLNFIKEVYRHKFNEEYPNF